MFMLLVVCFLNLFIQICERDCQRLYTKAKLIFPSCKQGMCANVPIPRTSCTNKFAGLNS